MPSRRNSSPGRLVPLVEGNLVRILCDAAENYPAWMEAIDSAERTIYFECYIISDDATGRRLRRCPRRRRRVTG